jgi:hypothetical protein
LDGNGDGTTSVGPSIVKEHWQPSAAVVSVATQTKQAQCSVYVGTSVQDGTLQGTTATGSSGDTCGFAGLDIQPGNRIWAVWTGGDPGSTATLVANGTRTIGAPE